MRFRNLFHVCVAFVTLAMYAELLQYLIRRHRRRHAASNRRRKARSRPPLIYVRT